MPEYINREAARNTLYDADAITMKGVEILNNFPAADVVEVRHGRWCTTVAYPHNIYCSECYRTFAQEHWEIWKDGSLPRDYCPSCGAIMDGGTENDHDQ